MRTTVFWATTLLILFSPGPALPADTILVPGNPPLTRSAVDEAGNFLEWTLDIRLPAELRRQMQEKAIGEWKKLDRAGRERFIRGVEDLRRMRAQTDDKKLAQGREEAVKGLRQASDPMSKKLLALYDAAHPQPSARGEILVAGDPPLTQNVIDQNQALYEWLLGIKLNDVGRDRYRERSVRDWKTLDDEGRKIELENARVWEQNAKLTDLKRRDWRKEILPRMLDNLSEGGNERARWLVETYRELWQEALDARPVAVLEVAPPRPPVPVPLPNGAVDAKPERIFDKPTVFKGSQLYGYLWYWPGQDALGRPTASTTENQWWFLSNGRTYLQLKSSFGPTSPSGRAIVSEAWGRYTLEGDFRVRVEFDSGEKAAAYLIDGRRSLLWGKTMYSGVGEKKSK